MKPSNETEKGPNPMKVDSNLFSCDLCEKKYKTYNHLNTHKNAKHEEKKYMCDECDYQSAWHSHFLRHKQSKHGFSQPRNGRLNYCDWTPSGCPKKRHFLNFWNWENRFEGIWPSSQLAVEGHIPSNLVSQNGNSKSVFFEDTLYMNSIDGHNKMTISADWPDRNLQWINPCFDLLSFWFEYSRCKIPSKNVSCIVQYNKLLLIRQLFSVFLPYMIEGNVLGMPQNANLAFCSREGGRGGWSPC